jgi:hypothetical protein
MNKPLKSRVSRAAILFAWAICAVMAACAPAVPRKAIDFAPVPASASVTVHTVTKEVTFSPTFGYPRTIASGSQWRLIGRTPKGDVYRPMAGVFTVEGAHVHESGIVIAQGNLIGFFLLVESAFVPLDPPVPLQLLQGAK